MAEDGNTQPVLQEQAVYDEQVILDFGTVDIATFDKESIVTAEYSHLKNPKTYDPGKHRDWVRASITYVFISIFALTVSASLAVVIWFGKDYPNLKDLLQPLLPAETGLIGSAVGFYFGSEIGKQRERG